MDRPADARKVWPNSIQRLEELAPLDLLAQFAVAEVLGLVFEQADPVHALVGLEQGLQLALDLRGQRPTEQPGDAQAFAGDGPPNHVLQIGVAGATMR